MPNPFHYRAVINRLAQLADAPNPANVQVTAAIVLSNELRPGTERARLALHMLQQANPVEFARHKLRDLYDGPDSLNLVPAETAGPTHLEEEEAPDEPEEPL